MVEDFRLLGKKKPSYSRLIKDIQAGRIPEVAIFSLPEPRRKVSTCIGYIPKGHKKIPDWHFLHVFPEGIPGVLPGDPDKISFFSRFGNNFEGVKALDRIADYYGLGYKSDDDGVIKQVPKKEEIR